MRKKDSAKPNELFPLETTEMRIIYNQHGVVTGYVQRQFNTSNLTEEQIEDRKIFDEETSMLRDTIVQFLYQVRFDELSDYDYN